MTNEEFVSSLRAIAYFYEENPECPVPYLYQLDIFVKTKEEIISIVKMLGTCEKKFNDWSFSVSKKFGEMTINVHLARAKVCERVVIGKKMVEKEVVLSTGKTMVEEEIVEWKCTDAVLLKSNEIPSLKE